MTLISEQGSGKAVKQKIKVSFEGYMGMLELAPTKRQIKGWYKLTKDQKIKAHAEAMASDIGYESYAIEFID